MKMEGEKCADGRKKIIQESIAERKVLLREKTPHFILKYNYIRVLDETLNMLQDSLGNFKQQLHATG